MSSVWLEDEMGSKPYDDTAIISYVLGSFTEDWKFQQCEWHFYCHKRLEREVDGFKSCKR